MNRSHLLTLLTECTGDDIWSIEYCHQVRVPETWIAECADAYESGFDKDSNTIYYRDRIVNQFEGVRDVDIACMIGRQLGINIKALIESSFSRTDLVRKIREAIEEDC
jgi:hypothetical protein